MRGVRINQHDDGDDEDDDDEDDDDEDDDDDMIITSEDDPSDDSSIDPDTVEIDGVESLKRHNQFLKCPPGMAGKIFGKGKRGVSGIVKSSAGISRGGGSGRGGVVTPKDGHTGVKRRAKSPLPKVSPKKIELSPRSAEFVRMKAKRASEKARRFLLERMRGEEMLAKYGMGMKESEEEEEEDDDDDEKVETDSSVDDVKIITSSMPFKNGRGAYSSSPTATSSNNNNGSGGNQPRRVAVRGKRFVQQHHAHHHHLNSSNAQQHHLQRQQQQHLKEMEKSSHQKMVASSRAATQMEAHRKKTALLLRYGSAEKIPRVGANLDNAGKLDFGLGAIVGKRWRS